MRHPNILGAGARRREHLKPKEKIGVVMSEFKRGTLHSGGGGIVHNKKQAIAIALSEARKKGWRGPTPRAKCSMVGRMMEKGGEPCNGKFCR